MGKLAMGPVSQERELRKQNLTLLTNRGDAVVGRFGLMKAASFVIHRKQNLSLLTRGM